MNGTVFYAGSGSTLYISTDSGASFKSVSKSLGSTRSIVAIAANPFTAGDFYIATDAAIFHSTNYGSNTVALVSTGSSYALSVGVPSESGGTPTLFAAGTIGGVTAIYRTDDNGANWSLLSDAKHGFGNIPRRSLLLI
jgi:xyloglucan-specific exo-beta-1,4-glucanase